MQRQLRLTQAKDFVRLRQVGRVHRHPFLTLSLAPNELTHNRYGFITGKHLGSAVTRNRVRRLLREVVRQHHPLLRQGFDVVLVARGPIVGETFASVERTLHEMFHRSALLSEQGSGQ